MTKPMTPAEFDQLKIEQVPEFIYQAINSQLLNSPCIRGAIVVSLDSLKLELSKFYTNDESLMEAVNKALAQYRNMGWNVRKSVFDWDDPEPEVINFNRA